MDFRQIETFMAVFAHGSLTAAARALGITQPAVSVALSRLERDVGFALFRRDGRQVAPTKEAVLLHAEALRIMADFEHFGATASEIATGRRGTLTIAANPGTSIALLPPVIAQLRRERPSVEIRILTRGSAEVRDLVHARAADLGFAEPPFDRSDAVARRYRLPVVAVMPAKHRLAKKAKISPADVEGESFIAIVQGPASFGMVTRAFGSAEIRLKPAITCEIMAVALNLVAQGAGICLAEAVSASSVAGAAVRPFDPPVHFEVALLRPARDSLTGLASWFVDAFDGYISPFLNR